jgi:surfactin synthase thioesterase subunit
MPSARLRLFCFPHAGGGASLFARWQSSLSPEIEVCAVQLPGREDRLPEAPITDGGVLMRALVDALLPWIDRPYAIFGHSFGARIGFELARLLSDRGQPPAHLLVSACAAPHCAVLAPPVGHLNDSAFLAQMMTRYKGIPRELLTEPDLLKLIIPALKADIRVLEQMKYAPGPPFDFPVSAFAGSRDFTVARQDVAAWEACTRAAFHMETLDADHFFIRNARDLLLRSLGRILRAQLEAAEDSPA